MDKKRENILFPLGFTGLAMAYNMRLKNELREELGEKLRTELREQLRTELREQLRTELREQLRTELLTELRKELKEIVKEAQQDDWNIVVN